MIGKLPFADQTFPRVQHDPNFDVLKGHVVLAPRNHHTMQVKLCVVVFVWAYQNKSKWTSEVCRTAVTSHCLPSVCYLKPRC